ncbi:MAG: hypothetical protein JWP44_5128, partial [Mucilaginibacter sp.]|nr:hypothetical protein [Mucilaginibacter sp.]
MTPSGGREGRQAILESPSDGGDDSVIYSGSDDDHYDSPTERQRRCNVQHNRFLDGRPVVILSAQLKGPFTKESGWRNPWLPKPTSPLAAGIPKATHRLASFREIASHSLQLQSPDSLSSERRPPINPYMQDTAWSRIQTWRRDVNPRDGLPLPVTPVKPSKPSTNAGNKRPASSAFLRSALAKKSKPNGFGQLMDECPSKPIRDHSSISADSAWTVSATSTAAIKASGKSHLDLSGSSQAAVDVSLAPESYSARALKNDHSISCNITTGASLGPPPTRGSSRVAVDMGMRRNGVRRPLSQPKAPVPKTNVPRPLAVRIHPVVHREGTMEDEADGRHPAGAVGLRAPTDTIEAHSRELNFQSQADQSFHYRSKAPNAANQVDDDEVEQIRFQPRSATSQSDLEDTESSMSEAGHRQSEEAAGIHVHQDKDSCTDETSSTN